MQHLDDGNGRAECTGDPLPVIVGYDDAPRWACTGCRNKGALPSARPRVIMHIDPPRPETRVVVVRDPRGGGGMFA